MPTVTVKAASLGKPWQNDKGSFQPYRLDVEGHDRPIELNRKVNADGSHKPINVGEQLDVTITPSGNDFPDKARINAAPFGGGGGRGMSPEERAKVTRMHSQEMALRYAAIKAANGGLPADFKPEQLTPIINFFDKDANEAKPK